MENVEFCTTAAIISETVRGRPLCARSIWNTNRNTHSTNRMVPSAGAYRLPECSKSRSESVEFGRQYI